MKRPCRNASQTSIIKMRELPVCRTGRHPIPLKAFNFNWMKYKGFIYLVVFLILFSGCGFIKKKLAGDDNIKQDTLASEQLLAIKTAHQDSIKKAEFDKVQKTAFGEIQFGMDKNELSQAKENMGGLESSKTIGKYTYYFNYAFNGAGQMYQMGINSGNEKTIKFDTTLKYKYQNLYEVIKTRYGAPQTHREYPSVFDVKRTGTYWIDTWEVGSKRIKIGLKEKSMNDYYVASLILDNDMYLAEQQRLKDLKNKDIIESAKDF